MINSLIFDLDGTLLLSEEYKIKAKLEAIKKFGGTISLIDFYPLVGQSEQEVAEKLIKISGITVDYKTFNKVAEDIYLPYIKIGIPFVTGARTFLEVAHNRGFKLALVTSSTKIMLDENTALIDILPLFSTIITAENVNKQKPNPEPYQRALSRLSIKPTEAIVFEDSEAGLQSSLAAGIPTIFIRHKLNAHLPATDAMKIITAYDTSLLETL